MANFNKVLLLGNVTRDSELTYTPNQTAVVSFGLAANLYRRLGRPDFQLSQRNALTAFWLL